VWHGADRQKAGSNTRPDSPVCPESHRRGRICFLRVFGYISIDGGGVLDMSNAELIRRLKILVLTLATYLALC
jgi:hypothetical protein